MEVATPATNAAVAAAAAREVAAVAALAAVEATRSPQSQQQHCFFIKVAKSSATQKEVENKKKQRATEKRNEWKKTEAPLFHFLGGFGTVDVVGHVITRSVSAQTVSVSVTLTEPEEEGRGEEEAAATSTWRDIFCSDPTLLSFFHSSRMVPRQLIHLTIDPPDNYPSDTASAGQLIYVEIDLHDT